MSMRWWKWSVMLSLFSVPVMAQVDFQGLIQGQTVLIRETRTEEFKQRPVAVGPTGRTVQASPWKVGKLIGTGDLGWIFPPEGPFSIDADENWWVTDTVYEGTLPDETGRSLPDSPVWHAQDSLGGMKLVGWILLIPNSAIPEGQWILTADLLYGVLPISSLESPSSSTVWFGFTCRQPEPHNPPVLGADVKKSFDIDEPTWKSESLSAALVGSLGPCKAIGGDIALRFIVNTVKRIQFNGVQVTMAQVQ